jgi:D-alanine--poly(phosphoribitol) ligase subunit 2
MVDAGALYSRITEMFVKRLNVEPPSVDTDLIETGILDSLALVELLLTLEQEFGIQIALDQFEIDDFRSIVRIAQFISGSNELAKTA